MDSAESENLKPEGRAQSVFSARSGIQDLLVRHEAAPTADEQPQQGAEKAEPENQPQPQNAPGKQDRKNRKSKSPRQIERVKRRQMNYLQERRAQKRRQVMFSRVRLLFKLCFAVLFSVLLWQIAQSPLWLYQKPMFTLRNNHLLQPSQVEPLVREWVGKPIYAIHTGQLARGLQQRFAVLDKVFVRRQIFPNRLEVLVTEKKPWAEIYTDEKQPRPYALLVPNGVISLQAYNYHPRLYRNDPLEKIIIPPRSVLTPQFMRQLQEIGWQARHVPGLHLEAIDVRNRKLVVLRFREIPVILGELNVNASQRLSRLSAVVPKMMELREALESVDLRWQEQVTFHKKPNARIVLEQDEPEAEH
jgi:cell division septal protein FtsQ